MVEALTTVVQSSRRPRGNSEGTPARARASTRDYFSRLDRAALLRRAGRLTWTRTRGLDHSLCARTTAQTPSSPTATPHGWYRNPIRVVRLVFGSILHTARSSGTAAQMPPAPAATEVIPPGRVVIGREMRLARPVPTAGRRRTAGAFQSPTQTESPSTTRGPELLATESSVFDSSFAACIRETLLSAIPQGASPPPTTRASARASRARRP